MVVINGKEVNLKDFNNKKVHVKVLSAPYGKHRPIFIEAIGKAVDCDDRSIRMHRFESFKSELDPEDHNFSKERGLWIHGEEILLLKEVE
jgi:hypothetical protein